MSLLDPSTDLAIQAIERAAMAESERPGTWYGDEGADGRRLTQEETDILIRAELWFECGGGPTHNELVGIIGEPRHLQFYGAPDLHGDQLAMHASRQRGGIDSDPLVRLLAYRAWGDRDRYWFEERGVRKGEAVSSLRLSPIITDCVIHLTWPGDFKSGQGTGQVAMADGWPGQVVEAGTSGANGVIVYPQWYRVSDRPRMPPEDLQATTDPADIVRRLFGFDELYVERDSMRRCLLITAGAHGARYQLSITDQILNLSADPLTIMHDAFIALADRLGTASLASPRDADAIRAIAAVR